ncbi:unnamed protein product [Didymodactylos carnosus]|uniref:FLYWCH-type domain-containing protein n=1 Tax=Didymodactylos carnosus TaxID=1234261 RepID=A0A815XXQ5_9BILA|nr:unnamed protein product [Didymodactylos carnosus]CAF4424757.1 unnamed protein product [Didymodactylos carnosus]
MASSSSLSTQSTPSSSLLSISAKPIITKTISNKGRDMLVIDGFEFQLKNSAKTIQIWRCANRDCGVILHTNIHNEFLRYSGKSTEHCHLPNTARVEVRNVKQLMRERAKNDLAPLQQIVEQEVRKALLTAEALALLPSHTLLQFRRKMTPILPDSSSFVIPLQYTRDYHNNQRLLLHDSDDPLFRNSQAVQPRGRVLVWSSDTQLELLFDSDRVFMDGTFSTCPPHFDQVYIIHGIVHDTCLPVVYALLPDRFASTYVYLINVLFAEAARLNKKFEPSLIMSDFEPALAKAVTLEVLFFITPTLAFN